MHSFPCRTHKCFPSKNFQRIFIYFFYFSPFFLHLYAYCLYTYQSVSIIKRHPAFITGCLIKKS